jgi:hypothetical protein
MKAFITQLAETPQTPVFPKAVYQLRTNPKQTTPKPKRRDNIFSKSRDTREDRGARQMKTSRDAQTFPHGR